MSHYQHWLLRDLKGNPVRSRRLSAETCEQSVSRPAADGPDLMASILSHFVDPPPLPPLRAQVIYQDRLRDENHHRDNNTTWALAPLLADTPSGARKVGAVLVAFDMSRKPSDPEQVPKGHRMVIFFLAPHPGAECQCATDKLRLWMSEDAMLRQNVRCTMRWKPSWSMSLLNRRAAYPRGAIDQAKGIGRWNGLGCAATRRKARSRSLIQMAMELMPRPLVCTSCARSGFMVDSPAWKMS